MSSGWLHLSDLQLGLDDAYERNGPMRALVAAVRERASAGEGPALLFVTGDLAATGTAAEYAHVGATLDALVDAAGLTRRELFVVPGNHDVDRVLGIGLARSLESPADATTYFRRNHPKPHITQKLGAFAAWYDRYFDGIRSFPSDTTCGPIEIATLADGTRVAILPINSALFSQGDDDREHLLVGRRAIDATLDILEGQDVDLRVAMVHHPPDWLSPIERTQVRAALHASVDVLLHGHLKESVTESVRSLDGRIVYAASGRTRPADGVPPRVLVARLDAPWLTVEPLTLQGGRREAWAIDKSAFPDAPGFERRLLLPGLAGKRAPSAGRPLPEPAEAPPSASFPSTVPARGGVPVVGRDAVIDRLAAALAPAGSHAVLYGPAGTGTSEVAFEYARRHLADYPAGTFVVDGRDGAATVDLAGEIAARLGLDLPSDLPIVDRAAETLRHLWGRRALLICDGAPSEGAAAPLVPPDAAAARTLATTVDGGWGAGWVSLGVPPLDVAAVMRLIAEIGGEDAAARLGGDIRAMGQGLPALICPAARVLASASWGGTARATAAAPADPAERFRAAIIAPLDPDARMLLGAAAFLNGRHLRRSELLLHLRGAGWSDSTFDDALDACLEAGLLDGREDLRLHAVVAATVATEPGTGSAKSDKDRRAAVTRVRQSQRTRFVELSTELVERPTDLVPAALLAAYPDDPEVWAEAGAPVEARDAVIVGRALQTLGRIVAARAWFAASVEARGRVRRDGQELGETLHRLAETYRAVGDPSSALPRFEEAVAAKRRGGSRGRVDHASLGASLHSVGACHAALGDDAAALPAFQEAVEQKRLGDRDGWVDHESLGASLHALGTSHARLGDHEAARPWFELAAEEKRRGDAHGTVDHESLAASLHQVGACSARSGDLAAARTWYEEAAAESRQGDAWGRVDYASLGASLRGVGYCVAGMGDYGAARTWHEQSVEAKRRGDLQGRVDHESVGVSLHSVGSCLSQAGDYDAAAPWYEQAVDEKRLGDLEGRIDHESVGRSLHQLAYCLAQAGDHAAARKRYEEAVNEARLGDVEGRTDGESVGASLHGVATSCFQLGDVPGGRKWLAQAIEAKAGDGAEAPADGESLGRSLHVMGNSYAEAGDHAAARPWYEQAAEAKAGGDAYGRIDNESLGLSLHAVGYSLAQLAEDAAARAWFERAVEAKRKGDALGRVDHESVGMSLHQVGTCWSQVGDHEAAESWYLQAVEEKRRGDVRGRIDHESLGKSLHLIGYCHAESGDAAAALPWYEQAVEEARLGDVRGWVDHESLGRSLHEVGWCYAEDGDYASARRWFEQAVEAKRLGDVHGRVDQASLRRSQQAITRARMAPRRLRAPRT